MQIHYEALDSDLVCGLRAGGGDAYGNPAERTISDGEGNPCRHCLGFVPKGEEMLILAHRPFGAVQPYAETGPIFLCAENCTRGGGEEVPTILGSSPDYLLKAYSAAERIIYGTGKIVAREDLPAYAASLLERPDVAFVDVRSARNNCFQLRIRRTAGD